MTIQCKDNIIGSTEDVDGVGKNGPIGAVIWGKAIRGVGQTFNDANHFRKVLKNYCISQKQKFKYE